MATNIIELADGTTTEETLFTEWKQHPESLIGKPTFIDSGSGYGVIVSYKLIDLAKPAIDSTGYANNIIIKTKEQTEEQFYARLNCFA